MHKLRWWLPAVAWAVLILSLSTGAFGAPQTSRFLRPLLESLFGPIDHQTFQGIHIVVRKLGHVVAYAVLSVLAFRGARDGERGWKLRWSAFAVGFCVLVAVGDEIRQSYFATRTGTLYDVGLDALSAVAAQWVIFRLWRRRKEEEIRLGL